MTEIDRAAEIFAIVANKWDWLAEKDKVETEYARGISNAHEDAARYLEEDVSGVEAVETFRELGEENALRSREAAIQDMHLLGAAHGYKYVVYYLENHVDVETEEEAEEDVGTVRERPEIETQYTFKGGFGDT